MSASCRWGDVIAASVTIGFSREGFEKNISQKYN